MEALRALGRIACDVEEGVDLSYNAFTTLQRAGAVPPVVTIMRALGRDEVLGESALSVLQRWATDG